MATDQSEGKDLCHVQTPALDADLWYCDCAIGSQQDQVGQHELVSEQIGLQHLHHLFMLSICLYDAAAVEYRQVR